MARGEVEQVEERYRRRAQMGLAERYDPLLPDVRLAAQCAENGVASVLARRFGTGLGAATVADIGCGEGGWLLRLLLMGVEPHNLVGIELLEERWERARIRVPPSTRVLRGEASDVLKGLSIAFHVLFCGTVFSSILSDEVRTQLAASLWHHTDRAGCILVFDMIFPNPHNRDVRPLTRRDVSSLFPAARIRSARLVLAPPIARRVCPATPLAAMVLAAIPLLCTHRLYEISKD
jgi:SAM-dependent methyltransferase